MANKPLFKDYKDDNEEIEFSRGKLMYIKLTVITEWNLVSMHYSLIYSISIPKYQRLIIVLGILKISIRRYNEIKRFLAI